MACYLYRIVETDPATVRDFVADRLRGHRSRLPDESDDEWDSFSAFSDLAGVRRTARYLKARRRLARLYIARIEIVVDAPFEVFPYRQSRTHFGIRGDAILILGCASIVESV